MKRGLIQLEAEMRNDKFTRLKPATVKKFLGRLKVGDPFWITYSEPNEVSTVTLCVVLHNWHPREKYFHIRKGGQLAQVRFDRVNELGETSVESLTDKINRYRLRFQQINQMATIAESVTKL